MNILGIIAEYNPLHNGHVYHIEEAKKKAKADYVVVIMSGSFTQQGNIGVIDKFQRASLAIKAGADLVLELPTIYATSSSEAFGNGAVDILNSLGCITHIAFGSECENIQLLESIAKKSLNNNEKILEEISKKSKEGNILPKASKDILQNILTKEEYHEIAKPNNILAIQYIKAIYALKSKIKPLLVLRENSLHGDEKIDNSCIYASSSAIRNELVMPCVSINAIQKYVPNYTLELFTNSKLKCNENIFPLLKYKIIALGIEGLKKIKEVSEGLENRLLAKLNSSSNYDEYISNVKCKRYTLGRIKRICINILLGITKDLDAKLLGVKYARVLKINKDKIDLLSILASSNIPVLTSINENKTNKLDSKVLESLKLDILATNIAELEGDINKDYTNNILE